MVWGFLVIFLLHQRCNFMIKKRLSMIHSLNHYWENRTAEGAAYEYDMNYPL